MRFARDEQVARGRTALAELPRLADLLAEPDGEIEWSLQGVYGIDRRPMLRLSMRAEPVLRCQRCLNAMRHVLERVSLLRLVRPGTPIGDEELEIDEFDTVEVGPDLDVIALIEDELVLALPIAPRHEQCEPPQPAGGSQKKSPFDVLANLRGSGRLQ
ncbi:YceD family protein [Pseudazoarcus pumilus]|nr:YceD family protein [Pseudazoarcus pumilus]